MKAMSLYKHKNNTDVAILVLKAFHFQNPYENKGYYKIKVRWFNIVNRANMFDMDSQEILTIEQDTFKNDWELIA